MVFLATDMATSQSIELYRLSPCCKALVPNERKLYIEKLIAIDSDDPHIFPSELWKSSGFPNLSEHDVFQYCIAKHSKSTGLQLSACKAIRDASIIIVEDNTSAIFMSEIDNSVASLDSCYIYLKYDIKCYEINTTIVHFSNYATCLNNSGLNPVSIAFPLTASLFCTLL